jgi:threonine dehydrogenase-like Zn-dependent dehydrogenase
MRQLTVVEKGRLEWLDVPEPRLESAGDALVRPLAVATCDLDPQIIKGATPFPLPIALGHECVGEIVELGDGIEGFSVGDTVAVPFQISCGECNPCRDGHTGNCASVPPLSMYGFGAAGGDHGGALSDLVRVPYADHMLVVLPPGVEPAAVASVGDNISDAWRTVAPQLERRRGASVLVVAGGAWSIGLYAAGLAVALGAGLVDYVDSDADRLERAKKLGAAPVAADSIDPDRPGRYEITVDASGEHLGLRTALRATAPDGICTSVSIFFEEETPLPLFEMYSKIITFHTGRCHARPAMPKALSLVADRKLAPALVTKATVQWEDAADALRDHEGKHVVVREAG